MRFEVKFIFNRKENMREIDRLISQWSKAVRFDRHDDPFADTYAFLSGYSEMRNPTLSIDGVPFVSLVRCHQLSQPEIDPGYMNDVVDEIISYGGKLIGLDCPNFGCDRDQTFSISVS